MMALPQVADGMAGRMVTVRMLPLLQVEIHGRPPTFLERLYKGERAKVWDEALNDNLIRAALARGFPEAVARDTERGRKDWAKF